MEQQLPQKVAMHVSEFSGFGMMIIPKTETQGLDSWLT